MVGKSRDLFLQKAYSCSLTGNLSHFGNLLTSRDWLYWFIIISITIIIIIAAIIITITILPCAQTYMQAWWWVGPIAPFTTPLLHSLITKLVNKLVNHEATRTFKGTSVKKKIHRKKLTLVFPALDVCSFPPYWTVKATSLNTYKARELSPHPWRSLGYFRKVYPEISENPHHRVRSLIQITYTNRKTMMHLWNLLTIMGETLCLHGL